MCLQQARRPAVIVALPAQIDLDTRERAYGRLLMEPGQLARIYPGRGGGHGAGVPSRKPARTGAAEPGTPDLARALRRSQS